MSWCSEPSGSFATIDSEIVAEKCQETIEHIKKERARKDKKTINYYRKKKYFFWGEKETDEEVADKLNNGTFSQQLSYPSSYAYATLKVANQLLRLCKRSKRIFLTREDASAIGL